MTTQTGDQTVSLRDPYPFFAQKRRDSSGAFHGTVMDYSKTPDSLVPKREYTAVSFNAVNTVFRNSEVFSSAPYDNTIGLFIGPSILAMEGKKHREHRNLVSAAFRSKALAQWEPTIVRPICDALGTWCGKGQPTKCHRAQGTPATRPASRTRATTPLTSSAALVMGSPVPPWPCRCPTR